MTTAFVLGFLTGIPALAQEGLMREAQDLFKPSPTKPPANEGNATTAGPIN